MFNKIKRKLTSNNLLHRILIAYICLLIVFITVTIASNYLLPQGFLRSKNPLQTWDSSSNLIISTLQFFSYNLISVLIILVANLFSKRKNEADYYISLGYTAFFVMILINAVTLGTWSFSVVTTEVTLIERIIGTFDIFHRGGLWEMSGQLFILCATAKISLVLIDGKETITRNWKSIKISKQEAITIGVGLILMLIGAYIESYAIINI